MSKLTRAALRSLKPGEKAHDGGVVYERLADGDGRWLVNIMVNRQRVHRVVGLESEGFTLTQARDLIATLRAKKHERRHGIGSKRGAAITVADGAGLYLDFLRETGGKDLDKKAERLRLHLVRLLGPLQLATLTAADLKRYATTRTKEGAKSSTINRELAVMSHLFRTGSDVDGLNILSAIPCRIPRLKEPAPKLAYLNPAQAAALLAAAEQDVNEHVLCFAWVGLHTGMRYASILALRVDELDLERRVIWIARDKTGERQQPITAALAAFLRAYVAERLPEGSTWLFPAPRSRTGHAVAIRKAWRRVVAAAGLDRVISPHTLRHTMASNAAHAGVDAPTLQAMGGWKSRRMVERYTHAGAMAEAMDKLGAAYGTVTQELHRPSRK